MPEPKDRFPENEVLRPASHRASGLQIALAGLACALIIGMMIYGLNRPISEGGSTAAAPSAAQTTGTAPPAAPQSGGNVAGGENAAPKNAAPQDQPAEQPVPEPQKPGATPDSATR